MKFERETHTIKAYLKTLTYDSLGWSRMSQAWNYGLGKHVNESETSTL
jgi:hypothetical protein